MESERHFYTCIKMDPPRGSLAIMESLHHFYTSKRIARGGVWQSSNWSAISTHASKWVFAHCLHRTYQHLITIVATIEGSFAIIETERQFSTSINACIGPQCMSSCHLTQLSLSPSRGVWQSSNRSAITTHASK